MGLEAGLGWWLKVLRFQFLSTRRRAGVGTGIGRSMVGDNVLEDGDLGGIKEGGLKS